MLNISENSILSYVKQEEFKAFSLLKKSRIRKLPLLLSIGILLVFIFGLFLPWTQNIQAKGYVTTRLPEQRPQAIQSVISGQIEQWYVREGDYVERGDTIVFLSEIKSEYFDPELLQRTSEQVSAKSQSVNAYDQKMRALESQYSALQAAMQLKTEQTRNKILQTRNKISIDSVDLIAYRKNLEIAQNQFSRAKELYEKGLKTQTEYQKTELKVQQDQAKVSVQENKLLNRKNELTNLFLELSTIEKEYADKLAKSLSDRESARSAKLESIAATAKLQNQLSNYSARQKFYHITAPQSGYITQTIKKGIGEIIKDGSDVVTIMPASYDLAIEMYLSPQDLPLMDIGERVLLRFDGWPAIVISGWPESSTGIFSGRIVVIDRFISDNGFYRILVSPDKDDKPWPEELRVGTGTNAFILLKDVPVWYEIWRQLNGFPPDYYQVDSKSETDVKLKAPLKSLK